MNTPSFISAGIRFTCVDCGQCCTGSPGVVRLEKAGVDALANYLGKTAAEIKQTHLTRHGAAWRIRERENGDCAFFDGRCTIYPVRPTQCRTYPFWFKNLRSESAWRQTTEECPGIGQGRFYSEDEILALVHEDMESDAGQASR